jgi:arylsulfatase A-like enzyme
VRLRHRRARGHQGEVIGRSPAPAVALAALCALGCPGRPAEIAYDLAARLPVADRWSSRQVLLFGTPSAEPHQAEGFYREAASGEGDTFLWARGEAEVSLTFDAVVARSAVADLAPYERVRGQSAEVLLNGRSVARFTLNDARHRYAFPLPAEAQRRGENRVRFVFAATASPSEEAGNPDRRQLAAAFHSLVVAPAGDPGLEDLLRRDAPPAFGATRRDGVPALQQVGPSVVRYAIRLPARAELRFTPAIHPAAAASAASVLFKVTLERPGAPEEELWSATIGPRAPAAEEVTVRLPGGEGDLALLGLHVAGPRFAWGTWTAPRVMGAAASVEDAPRRAEEERRGDRLREATRGMNVVLVILDAARADHFGTYGHPRPTTPEIDRIAGEAIVFERAYTPAVYTLGAMASLWTSQPPDRHHGEVSFSAKLPRDRLTLAELLGARGVHTAGFVANTVAGGLNGFDRGFSEFHELWRTVGSRGDVFRAVWPGWLDANGGRRFFAYLHFREPHSPYDPEPPFDTRFGPDGPIPKSARRPPGDRWIVDVNQGRRTLTPEETDHLRRLYDGNLAYADREVGELRRALEARGLWDRTVFIVASDHGEALLDHGWIGHNVQLYEESIRVPLIVRFPPAAGVGGRRVKALSDLIDVAPTIADLFGAAGAGGSNRAFAGRSLLPVVEGTPGKSAVLSRTVWDRPIYARSDGRRKLVYETRTGATRLYDLEADPGERTDRAAAEPIVTAYHRQSLQETIARLSRRPVAAGDDAGGMTREQCENLKTLGYVSASFDCSKLR